MADNRPLSGSNCFDMACWEDADFTLRTSFSPCGPTEEECCNVDQCVANCTSVCDGFVDCDKSTVCSESHCDDSDCHATATACFDENCVTEGHQGLPQANGDDFLNPDGSFHWGSMELSLGSSMDQTGYEFQGQNPENPVALRPSPNGAFHCQNLPTSTKSLRPEAYGHSRAFNAGPDLIGNLCMDNALDGICLDNTHNSGLQYQLGSISEGVNGDGSLDFGRFPHHQNFFHNRYPETDISLQSLASQFDYSDNQTVMASPASPRTTPSLSLASSPTLTPTGREFSPRSALTSPNVDSKFLICKWTQKQSAGNVVCDALFHSAADLQEHLMLVHSNPSAGVQGQGYYCCWENCSRAHDPFSQKSKLQGHFLTHSNYKSFQCSTCGKTFARQATLERHERSHRGDKPYKCECGKTFTDSSELKTHMRTHTGEKPFKCNHPGCNFETGDSSNMSSHKLTHGERKHKCPFPGCLKSFTRPDQLKRHLRGMHKQDNITSNRLMSSCPLSAASPKYN